MKKYKYRKTFSFNGKRYVVRADSAPELYMKLANRMRDLEEGEKKLSPDMLVKDWANQCVETYKTNLLPASLKNYKSKMNKWIIEEIGNMRLTEVKPLHCQQILNKLDGYAKETQQKIRQILFFTFEKAKENSLIRSNPALKLTLPRGTTSKRRAITQSEKAVVLSVADSNPKYIYFLFILFCGCRPSEVAMIEGRDIQKMQGQPILHIRGTKTVNADRKVPIPDYLMRRINMCEPFEVMFKNENNRPMTPNNRQTLWNHFKRDMNIALGCQVYRNEVIPPYAVAPDFTPYCLRHTYCTDLCAAGVDIRTAQYLMGHSDISLTANIYTHIDEKNVLSAAELINLSV